MSLLPKIRIRINRRELSGAFGDIGTDLPLLTGMILASGTMVSYVPKLWGYVQQLLRESNMGERTNA